MARRNRLDAELVRRGLARSREQAAELVEPGRVEVRGTRATKAAAMVDPADPVRVLDADGRASSCRGARTSWPARWPRSDRPGCGWPGRRCLDAGASTGGFTELLLRAGRGRSGRRRRGVRATGVAVAQ